MGLNLKTSYVPISEFGSTEYVPTHKTNTHMHNALQALYYAKCQGEKHMTCHETLEFIELCKKKSPSDELYGDALASFETGGLELLCSLISFPNESGMHEGVRECVYLSEDAGIEHDVPEEYAGVPLLLEDFKIDMSQHSYRVLCKTIKPLPKFVLDIYNRMGESSGQIITLEEDVPQLGLLKKDKLYVHIPFTPSEKYSILLGKDFSVHVYGIQDYPRDAIYYREKITSKQMEQIMQEGELKHSKRKRIRIGPEKGKGGIE